jgi:hypothetical protein
VDPKFCGMINNTWQRGECYSEIAKIRKDGSICDKVESIGRSFCYAVATQDLSACEKMDGATRDECYHRIALFKTDPSICQNIRDDFARELCYRYSRYYKDY